jgi:MFS family permease
MSSTEARPIPARPSTVRPLGGVVMGHFGDNVGRKSMLVTSLMLMGIATVGIGLLPTYATIGYWAPLLLVTLRFIQGIGVGGEWGGAVLMAVAHAPPTKRASTAASPRWACPADSSWPTSSSSA